MLANDVRLVSTAAATATTSLLQKSAYKEVVVKPKFHYGNFPETSPDEEVSRKSRRNGI